MRVPAFEYHTRACNHALVNEVNCERVCLEYLRDPVIYTVLGDLLHIAAATWHMSLTHPVAPRSPATDLKLPTTIKTTTRSSHGVHTTTIGLPLFGAARAFVIASKVPGPDDGIVIARLVTSPAAPNLRAHVRKLAHLSTVYADSTRTPAQRLASTLPMLSP